MKEIVRIAITVLVLSLQLHVHAMGDDVCIYHPTGGDQISCICTDQMGTMWLGTNHGLTRMVDYAHSWDTWMLRPSELQQGIDHIQCAQDGRLWICSTANSYMIYDPRTNQLTADLHSVLRSKGLDVQYNFQVLADGEKIWISSHDRLYCMDGPLERELLPMVDLGYEVKKIFIGEQWLYAVGQDKLSLVDRSTGQVMQTVEVETPFMEKIKSAEEDRDGNLWFVDGRISRYDAAAKTWEIVSPGPVYGNIVQMNNGTVAISSTDGGVFFYGTDGRLDRHLCHRSFDSTSLSSNRVNYIHLMSNGTLLICYCRQGFAELIDSQDMVLHPIRINDLQRLGQRDDVSALWPDTSGCLWIGLEGEGLYRMPAGSYTPEKFSICPETDDATITAIYIDSRGTLWVGTYLRGIFRRSADGRVTHLMQGMSVSGIDEDNRGNLLLACQKHGVMRIPDGGTTVEKVDNSDSWTLQVSAGPSRQALFTTSEGLGLLNTSTLEYRMVTGSRSNGSALTHQRLSSVCRDSRGLVWTICSPGRNKLNMLDLEHDTIYQFPVLDIVNVNNVIEDQGKTIWVFSEQKLVNILPTYDTAQRCYTFRYRYYSTNLQRDELQFNPRVIATGSDGCIYQGTNQGLVVINPSRMATGHTGHPGATPIFALLKVNNTMVAPGHPYNGHHILHQDIAFTQRIDLRYDENNIDLGLAIDNHLENQENTRVCYRIPQLDADWTEAENDVIALHNLQPGTYTLTIGTIGQDGIVNATSQGIVLHLSPPLWASTWAYIAYLATLSGILVAVVMYWRTRRHRRKALQALQDEAERQNKINNMKLNFLTNVSHDFRTPLSLILSPIEELLDGKTDSATRSTLQTVHRNAMRLQTLVNQIIDLRRIEANAETLNLTLGNIMPLLEDKCADFAILAREHRIRLEVQGSSDSIKFYFDAEKMDKIIANLLSNAFKYTPDGGRILITATETAHTVCIRVSDTGCGIPLSEQQRVFDIFYQMADSSKNKVKGGSGIGLHIVKSMVDLHEGTISIQDNVPQGTIFVITLPRRLALADEQQLSPASSLPYPSSEVPGEISGKEQLTVLVVEDNIDLQGYLRESLASDYRVLCSPHGRDAVDQLTHQDVDIVISDIMMEEMDGLELCRYIRSDVRLSHIPIILLTAKTMPADELAGLQLGADDYVVKPFHLSILRLRIRNALLRRTAQHQRFAQAVELDTHELAPSNLDEEFLQKAIDIVEKNLANPDFSVENFSAGMYMHRTGLYKKLVAVTGKSPVEFIRSIRLKKAYRLLREDKVKVSDAAYHVGFNSPKLFTRYFKEEFGITPSELRSGES